MEPVQTAKIGYMTVFDPKLSVYRQMTVDESIKMVAREAHYKEENTPLTWRKQLIVVPIKIFPAWVSAGIGYFVKDQLNRRDGFELRALVYDSKSCQPYYDRSYTFTPSLTVSQVVMIVAAAIIFCATFFLFLNKTCSRFIEFPFRDVCLEHRKYIQELTTKYPLEKKHDVLTDENELKTFCQLMNYKPQQKKD